MSSAREIADGLNEKQSRAIRSAIRIERSISDRHVRLEWWLPAHRDRGALLQSLADLGLTEPGLSKKLNRLGLEVRSILQEKQP